MTVLLVLPALRYALKHIDTLLAAEPAFEGTGEGY